VVLDPPYEFEPLGPVVEAALRFLAPDGLLILEHAFRRALPAVAGARVTRTVRSGDSALTMFEAHVDR
jgi:16S rRNA G966 N2-methylase RsmD